MTKKKTWLHFTEASPQPKGKKTKVWGVYNAENFSYLGEVKWHGAWRQYTFVADDECIWNPDCLDELGAFLRKCMDDWRAAKKLADVEAAFGPKPAHGMFEPEYRATQFGWTNMRMGNSD